MVDSVFDIDHPAARLVANAGGKGAALARMRNAGLPVPPGFVVSTQAFWSVEFTLPAWLKEQLATIDATNLQALDPLCQRARQYLIEAGLPSEVAAAVTRAYQGIMSGVAVAVHSSATAEDQPWASFAGQYDTFLNVVGAQALLDRLLRVWASLYSTRGVAYRKQLRIPDDSVRMAVVVQRQLGPNAAGVMFTHDPITGDGNHYLINAALGVGEGVVTGQVPSDRFTLDASTFAILEQKVTQKDAMMVLLPEGGVGLATVPETQRDLPALTARQLTELARLAQQVTELFHGPQDIEFAAQEESIYLLQARPVTTISESETFPIIWEDPVDASYTWEAIGQGVTTRLQQDIIRAYMEGQKVCFEETGVLYTRNFIYRFFNGYTYVRSPDVIDSKVIARQRRYDKKDQVYREHGTTLYEAEIRPEVERTLAELGRFRHRGASLHTLITHLERALKAYGRVMGDLHWRMAASTLQDWPSTYHEITGEPDVASGTLLQAIPNRTTQLVKRVRSLARLVQHDPDLRTAFSERSYESLDKANLRHRPAVQRFRARFRRLLHDYGLRSGRGFGSSIGITAPTWNMAPHQPLDLIAFYTEQDLDKLEMLEASTRRVRIREKRRLRRLLATDRGRLERFDSALALAVEQVKMMENHNYIMEQGVAGAFREAIYWMGYGLVRVGLLDDPDDILHLSVAELRDIAASKGIHDLRTWVQEREAELRTQSRLRPPATIGSSESPPINPQTRFDPPPGTGLDDTWLRGVGASPGKVVGRARLVNPSMVLPKVERGEILVAQNAGPAWTPIFPLLGGLVLDQGAVFQHAALVAREYGIPAVILTRDATSVVTNGQLIGVDADQGIVDLVPSV